MRIIPLEKNQDELLEQCAAMLVDAFKDTGTTAWPDLAAARREILAALEPGKVLRALISQEQVLGFVGGQPHYDGHVWEVHPLVVGRDHRGKGYGLALLTDLESQAKAAGAGTLWVGADDENGRTSLSKQDLYANPSKAIATAENLADHPIGFYQRCGFVITGVLPDANGPGKPDIFLAKRISTDETA